MQPKIHQGNRIGNKLTSKHYDQTQRVWAIRKEEIQKELTPFN